MEKRSCLPRTQKHKAQGSANLISVGYRRVPARSGGCAAVFREGTRENGGSNACQGKQLEVAVHRGVIDHRRGTGRCISGRARAPCPYAAAAQDRAGTPAPV
ncbi:hypothetical protein SKAU_G00375270 [Synaphobranchus kaupii]|uniref:Uncharacterized protein n=1 Tax=Synaphobranchus kaupii TaxID=118154 RepID=A0A9Q1EGU6_SYNKA|nr:hypothetical protein SKAU_G00375270 [Synaphobranchus kaupii]